jgi:hypothetical protein
MLVDELDPEVGFDVESIQLIKGVLKFVVAVNVNGLVAVVIIVVIVPILSD